MTLTRAVCRGAPAVALAVFLSGVVVAQERSTFEQITVGTTAVGITGTITNPAGRQQMNRCVIQTDTTIRWRDDGTNPTATVGMLAVRTDDPIIASNVVARRIRFISTSASNATVNVTCYP